MIAPTMQQAIAAYGGGQWDKAEQLCKMTLASQGNRFDALNLLGVIAAQTSRPQQAADLFKLAVAAQPGNASAHNNYGNALKELQRHAEADLRYARAIEINPNYAEAHFNRGINWQALKRLDEAHGSYRRAVKIRPDYAEAHFNCANLSKQLGRFEEALSSYRAVLRLRPDFADAHFSLGNVYLALSRFAEAIDAYDQAIRIQPKHADAYNNRGNALQELRRYVEALDSYQRAIEILPRHAEAYCNRGDALRRQQRFRAALESYDSALKISADHADAHCHRGAALCELRRFDQATLSYERALALRPEQDWLYGNWLHAKMQSCEWRDLDRAIGALDSKIMRQQKAIPPLALLALTDSLPLQRRAAEIWALDKCPSNGMLPALPKRAAHQRIRIGYFSGDFRDHPVARLMAEMLEMHDRSCFEVIAFSFGPDTQDELNQRVANSVERFIEVRDKSDIEIAILARTMELDIAVDLGGFTDSARPMIFALRAAPIQVSYLGFLGTMGVPNIDYLIADATLIPIEHRMHYAEKLVYLPSYQANDSTRQISARHFSRDELGLPAEGFVFCCFNATYKITPRTFDSWMRILMRVPGSVLWLLADAEYIELNLKKEGLERGIEAHRLIFAKRLPPAEYLARYRMADLFLDTLPYNAGTTASDALWAGLPVLTRMGESFAGRIAASLLNAILLPEMITLSQAQYEATAIALATDPARLMRIKEKLQRQGPSAPLFDGARFTRSIENAFMQMAARYRADLSPEHIQVA